MRLSNEMFSCLPTGQNDLDPHHQDQVTRQNRIKQLEYNYAICAKVNARMRA